MSPSLPVVILFHAFCISGCAAKSAALCPMPFGSGSTLLIVASIIMCANSSAFVGLVLIRSVQALIGLSPSAMILLRVAIIASTSLT